MNFTEFEKILEEIRKNYACRLLVDERVFSFAMKIEDCYILAECPNMAYRKFREKFVDIEKSFVVWIDHDSGISGCSFEDYDKSPCEHQYTIKNGEITHAFIV